MNARNKAQRQRGRPEPLAGRALVLRRGNVRIRRSMPLVRHTSRT